MKNDTDLPQSVTILEHVQKPTKQRFFVLGILFVSLSIIYLDRVNISIIAANTHFLNEMHLNDKPILVGLLMSLFLGRCEQVPDMRSSYSSGAHPRGTS